jgi:hypothetical protein
MSEEQKPRHTEANIGDLPPEAISGEEAVDVKGGALSEPPDPSKLLNTSTNLSNTNLTNTTNTFNR